MTSPGPARLRFPGGRLRPADWTALATIAAESGGAVHLAARGHLRIDGIGDAALLRERAREAGLPTDTADDRARDIIASPMAGRLDGHHDLSDLPQRLDAALAGRRDVAPPGDHLLFGLDDSSGDVLAHAPDLAAVAMPGGRTVRLHVAGRDVGVATPVDRAPTVLARAADVFAGAADGVSRVPTSGRLHHLVVVALTDHPDTDAAPVPAHSPAPVPPVGWVDAGDGSVSLLAVVPHGVVPARLAEFLGAVDRPSTVSADRVIGLHGLTEGMAEQVVRVLAPMGMVFDAASPWVGHVPESG